LALTCGMGMLARRLSGNALWGAVGRASLAAVLSPSGLGLLDRAASGTAGDAKAP
jgi:hypothetical protein